MLAVTLVRGVAYRPARGVVSRLPPRLLRFRPYSVYAIPVSRLAETADGHAEAGTRLADSAGQTPPRGDETIRWIASPDEVAPMYGSAVGRSFAEWDGAANRAAVMMRAGEPIACAWVASGGHLERELAVRYELAPADRWVYATLVAPEHRRRGCYTRLLAWVGEQLRGEGAGRVLLGIVTGNTASHHAHQRWRPEPVGSIFAARSLGVTVCVCRGGVRRRGMLPLACRKPLLLSVG
ncbi:MAG: GNAT family N-acetyltransferase [Planctomycetota bacterium]